MKKRGKGIEIEIKGDIHVCQNCGSVNLEILDELTYNVYLEKCMTCGQRYVVDLNEEEDE